MAVWMIYVAEYRITLGSCMWTGVVTKNINLASATFRRCSDKIAHSPLRWESSFYDGSRKKLQLFSKVRDTQAWPAPVRWQGKWFKMGKNCLSSTKSHFLLPSGVTCHLEVQSQTAIIHSHPLTLPDSLCTCGAVFLRCLQKPSPFIWWWKLEMHLLNKGRHGFCALTVNTVGDELKPKWKALNRTELWGLRCGRVISPCACWWLTHNFSWKVCR